MIKAKVFSSVMLVSISAALVSGCSPIVFVDKPAAGTALPAVGAAVHPVTLDYAYTYGDRVKLLYRMKISDQMMMENAAGGGLIAVAASAFGLAATGTHPHLLAGLGAGASAGYVGARTYASKQQQLIYAAGAGAVTCSIQATIPMRVAMADRAEIKRLVEGDPQSNQPGIKALRDELQRLVDRNAGGNEPQEILDARAAITNADAAYSRGLGALITLDGAGETLLAAIYNVETQVDRALIEARPDLGVLYSALATSIPAAASQITRQGPAQVAPTTTTRAGFRDEADRPKVTNATNALVEKTRRLDLLADKVAKSVSVQLPQNCGADIDKAGSTLALDRTGDLTVDVSGGAKQVTINASGGTAPYLARWSGVTPTSGITLKMGDRFDGTIVIDLEKNAPAGRYDITVSDGARGRVSVALVVNASTPTTTTLQSTAAEAPKPEPIIQKLQNDLITAGITSAAVDGVDKKLVADGIWGEVTREAVRKYLKDIAKIDVTTNDRASLIEKAREKGL